MRLMSVEKPSSVTGRRDLLRRAVTAGAVGWTAPVILTSAVAHAGVFSPKCAPGTVGASASFVRTACDRTSATLQITITFSGLCPCGGGAFWCTRKNSPTPAVTGTTSSLAFSVTLAAGGTITITGKVALGCIDRDNDRQYAVYDWSMTASDNNQPCNQTTNTITQPVLSNRTLVTQATCPTLTAAVAVTATRVAVPGAVRPA